MLRLDQAGPYLFVEAIAMITQVEIILIHLLTMVDYVKMRAEETNLNILSEYINILMPNENERKEIIDSSIEYQWILINDMCIILSRIYRSIPQHLRPYIFQDYEKAPDFIKGHYYAPKVEVEHFCMNIEPLILENRMNYTHQ